MHIKGVSKWLTEKEDSNMSRTPCKSYVVFESAEYPEFTFALPVDTEQQREDADACMRERGIAKLMLCMGDINCPDSYWAGQWYYLSA